jgi:hypothetical protein
MTAGFSTTTHFDAATLPRPVIAPAVARTNRAARALRRNRIARLHRHGFAPDQEHGVRELGSIYDFDDPAQLESTVFVCTLGAGSATLLTVGRWDQGFFDLQQLVLDPSLPAERIDGIAAFVRGARRVLAVNRTDVRALEDTVASVDLELAQSLGRCALLPVVRDRVELLDREQGVLGLVREDLVGAREVREAFREAMAADPMALRRLLDAGRMDLLTGHALYMERLLR